MDPSRPLIAALRATGVRPRTLGDLRSLVRGWRLDLAPILGDEVWLGELAQIMADQVSHLQFQQIVGIDRGGRALAAALYDRLASSGEFTYINWPLAADQIPRSRPLELKVLVVDDIVNSGRTARRAIRRLQASGVTVVGLVVVVNYWAPTPRRS
jgi:orotate phosphoribosyltransferase